MFGAGGRRTVTIPSLTEILGLPRSRGGCGNPCHSRPGPGRTGRPAAGTTSSWHSVRGVRGRHCKPVGTSRPAAGRRCRPGALICHRPSAGPRCPCRSRRRHSGPSWRTANAGSDAASACWLASIAGMRSQMRLAWASIFSASALIRFSMLVVAAEDALQGLRQHWRRAWHRPGRHPCRPLQWQRRGRGIPAAAGAGPHRPARPCRRSAAARPA